MIILFYFIFVFVHLHIIMPFGVIGNWSIVEFFKILIWFYGFQQKNGFVSLKQCAISLALAVGLVTGVPALGWPGHANAGNLVYPDVSVLISGPPIKDPGALLRYALPIDNKAIREVQKPLEDITESLKVAGVKALDSVERVRIYFHTFVSGFCT